MRIVYNKLLGGWTRQGTGDDSTMIVVHQPAGMHCDTCKDTGMTGWEKPMGNPPVMVFVPQPCQCIAGDKYRVSNYSKPSIGCICPPGANLQCKNPSCPRNPPDFRVT